MAADFYPAEETDSPAEIIERSFMRRLLAQGVEPGTQITEVELKKTSGHAVLDRAALDIVRNRWRFPAGAERFFEWTCAVELKK